MEFELVLVRHGETGHNKERVIQGQLDIPLSINGVNQAKLLGKNLNGATWKEVWSSDLKRAWQTANYAINQDVDLEDDLLLSQPLPIIHIDPRMRERYFGTAQGKSWTDIKLLADAAGVELINFVPPEAETVEDIRSRCISFFDELCARQFLSKETNSSVLLVSHGGWLRELMMHLSSSAQICNPTHMAQFGRICPNTGVSRFQVCLADSGVMSTIKCLSIHEDSHLQSVICDQISI